MNRADWIANNLEEPRPNEPHCTGVALTAEEIDRLAMEVINDTAQRQRQQLDGDGNTIDQLRVTDLERWQGTIIPGDSNE